MPFGLRNSPSVFSRLMTVVLSGLIGLSTLVYLDDIIVFSKTVDEHVQRLTEVLQHIKDARLKIQLEKSAFFQSSVKFLGHRISAEGVQPHEDHYQAIKNWPVPATVKQVRGFLGLIGYF